MKTDAQIVSVNTQPARGFGRGSDVHLSRRRPAGASSGELRAERRRDDRRDGRVGRGQIDAREMPQSHHPGVRGRRFSRRDPHRRRIDRASPRLRARAEGRHGLPGFRVAVVLDQRRARSRVRDGTSRDGPRRDGPANHARAGSGRAARLRASRSDVAVGRREAAARDRVGAGAAPVGHRARRADHRSRSGGQGGSVRADQKAARARLEPDRNRARVRGAARRRSYSRSARGRNRCGRSAFRSVRAHRVAHGMRRASSRTWSRARAARNRRAAEKRRAGLRS